MNSFQRVMHALQGKPTDRPPVFMVLSAYGAKLTGIPLPDVYRDAEKYVDSQQAVIDTFGTDMVVAPFDLSIIAEAFGGKVAFFEDQPPNVRQPGTTDVQQALSAPIPNIETAGRFPFMLEATRKLSAQFKEKVPVFAVVPGPGSLPALIIGMEAWMEVLLFDDENAAALLRKSGQFWEAWTGALFAAGADALICTEGMASSTICTRELFEQKLLPHIQHCFHTAAGPLVFHHTGGTINHVLDLLTDLPSLAGLAISSEDHISNARSACGPSIPLIGTLDNLSFPTSTAASMLKEARIVLAEGLRNKPFILGNSGGDIPLATPPETIQAVVEVAKEQAEINWLSCGVFKNELMELQKRGALPGQILFMDSMLHMNPLALEKALRGHTDQKNKKLILVYGDCCPAMLQISQQPNVFRVDHMNCCQMLVGKTRYRELMREEAFMLIPEWTLRWKEVMEQELGLSEPVAADFFNEHRKKLVYLDTGLAPVPEKELNECAAFTMLPLHVEKVGLGPFEELLLKTLDEARQKWEQK